MRSPEASTRHDMPYRCRLVQSGGYGSRVDPAMTVLDPVRSPQRDEPAPGVAWTADNTVNIDGQGHGTFAQAAPCVGTDPNMSHPQERRAKL